MIDGPRTHNLKGVGRMADENNPAKGVRGRLPAWPRNALNPSVISAEQAYRKRSNLPLLSDAGIEALKAGQPMPWEQRRWNTASGRSSY